MPVLFQYGSAWLRANFHLHTDNRFFTYADDESYYVSNYVNDLEKAGIRLGVITNHDKFDATEFQHLSKVVRVEGFGPWCRTAMYQRLFSAIMAPNEIIKLLLLSLGLQKGKGGYFSL